MITRSACIKRAQAKMLQAGDDPLYSYEDWSDFFQSSVMRVWRELLDLKQVYFCKRNYQITHISEGVYQLPEDFHELLWVVDPNGDTFRPVGLKAEHEDLKVGWTINGNTLVIVNSTDHFSYLSITYRHFPKELPDWAGADDPETDNTYELDYPLNNQRGLRLISNMIPVMAKVKDGSITEAEFELFFNQELKNFMPRFFADMTSK